MSSEGSGCVSMRERCNTTSYVMFSQHLSFSIVSVHLSLFWDPCHISKEFNNLLCSVEFTYFLFLLPLKKAVSDKLFSFTVVYIVDTLE